MARYLVTGGAGFIGSNLVKELVRRRHQVTILDNLSTGKKENLGPSINKIQFIKGDIRHPGSVSRAMRSADFVLHHAAVIDVHSSVNKPVLAAAVNIHGTITVLQAAQRAKVKHLVFASSAAVYGNTGRKRQHEGLPTQPTSPYGTTKLAGEHFCRHFSELFHLPTTALRYFNVFGPPQRGGTTYAAVIPLFTRQVAAHSAPTIYGTGRQTRDFVYISDVVTATLLAAGVPHRPGQAYNIAGGKPTSILQLIEQLQDELGVVITPRFVEPRPGELTHSRASIARAKKELTFTPHISFSAGMRHFIRWYKKQTRTV